MINSKLVIIQNVIVILFFVVVSYVCGMWNGYIIGTENVNNRLVVNAYNAGNQDGFSRALYVMFEEYVNEHPYKIEIEDYRNRENK